MGAPIEHLADDELASDEQHTKLYELLVGAASELTPDVDDVDETTEDREAA